jgi:uncharacterized membrane protein YqaE (UPF0057 family)
MLWILAIILPPLAILLCGKPFQALINIILTLLGWIPGVLHALLVVADHNANQRAKRLERAVERQTEAMLRAEQRQLRRQQHR